MSMLDETLKHARRKTVGLKQTQRAMEKGLACRVYIAEDAEKHVLRPILDLCATQNVKFVKVPTMKELGIACGIEVGTAVAAVLEE